MTARPAHAGRTGRRAGTTLAVRYSPSVVTLTLVVLAWAAYAAVAPGQGQLVPAPPQVGQQLAADGSLIAGAVLVTLGSAGKGLLIGLAVAVSCCILAVALPPAHRPTTRVLTIVYCVPLAAIAPLAFLLLPLPGPHVALAAIAVVFPIYIAMVQGLTARHPQWEDLTTVLGGSRVGYFVHVRLPAATGQFLVAARLAGPTAILGATLAEYFGGRQGVGVLMINSMAQVNAPRAYALGLVITLLCVASYLLVNALARLVPWTAEVAS